MVQKSGILNQFFLQALTLTLYLNSVSELEKIEDSKNLCFPENGVMVLLEIPLYNL